MSVDIVIAGEDFARVNSRGQPGFSVHYYIRIGKWNKGALPSLELYFKCIHCRRLWLHENNSSSDDQSIQLQPINISDMHFEVNH